jgi:hypothetical protein
LISDVLQVVGALAILVPFVLLQMKRVDPKSTAYLLPNLGGSVVLAVLAALGRDWGFLLLEVAWAVTAGWSLIATPKPGGTAAE